MMEKDKTITELLSRLEVVINITLIEIVDYWDADLCAIGLKKSNRLVYVSTFNYVGNVELSYDFDLEVIDENEKEQLKLVMHGRNVSESDLVNEIKKFLDV